MAYGKRKRVLAAATRIGVRGVGDGRVEWDLSIGHPFGGHDDCAVVVAALMSRIVGGSGAPALIKYKDFLYSNGEPYTGTFAHYASFISLAVDHTGKAAVLHWAGHPYLNLAYISRGFAVVPIPYRQKGPILDDWPNLRIILEAKSLAVTPKCRTFRATLGHLGGGAAVIQTLVAPLQSL